MAKRGTLRKCPYCTSEEFFISYREQKLTDEIRYVTLTICAICNHKWTEIKTIILPKEQ
jgi:hypothetical protein